MKIIAPQIVINLNEYIFGQNLRNIITSYKKIIIKRKEEIVLKHFVEDDFYFRILENI